LELKHDEVVAAKKKFEKDGVTVDIDPALCGIAGQAFVNKSDFTLRDLKSRTNQQQLRKDFIVAHIIYIYKAIVSDSPDKGFQCVIR